MSPVNRRSLWRKLNRAPSNVVFADLEQLLLLSGWEFERQRGSHVFYRHGEQRLSVPFRRGSILAVYVRDVLRRTERPGDRDA